MGSSPSKNTATVTPAVTNGHSTTVAGSEYERAQERIRILEQENAKLSKDLHTQSHIVTAKEEQVATIRAQLDIVTAEQESQRLELHQVNQNLKASQTQQQKMTEMYEKKEKEWQLRLEQEGKKNQELTNKLEEETKKCTDLTSRLEEETTKSTSLQAQFSENTKALAESTEHEQKLSAAIEDLRREIAALPSLDSLKAAAAKTKAAKVKPVEASPSETKDAKEETKHVRTASHALQSIHKKLLAVSAMSRISRPMEDCAVSLAWLQSFAKDIDPTWTTLDVVQKLVIPKTSDTRRRYTDRLAWHEYGAPTFFVSHRWSDRFRELVETLTSHCHTSGAGDAGNVYLWIDIFAVNQHSGAGQISDLAKLTNAIVKAARGTLLIMDDRGGVLTRIWCLYEIHQTVQQRPGNDADLIMLMPKNVDATVMKEVWTELDVEKAEATVLADRDRILADIRKSEINTKVLNHSLKSTLVKSSALQVDAARDTLLSALVRSAQMVDLTGQAEKAKILMEEAISVCVLLPDQTSNAMQLKLAKCQYELSRILCTGLSQHTEALEWNQKALDLRRQLLGPSHLDLAISLDYQAWILFSLRRYEEAEKFYIEALTMQTELFPDEHKHTAEIMNNYSLLMQRTGRLEAALQMQEKASTMRLKLFGSSHPMYSESLLNTADLLRQLKRPLEAILLQKTSLTICDKVYSDIHPETAGVHHALATSYEAMEDWTTALEHRQHVLRIRLAFYGRVHLRTGLAEYFLSTTLQDAGRHEEALLHCDEGIHIYTELAADNDVRDCQTLKVNSLLVLNRGEEATKVREDALIASTHKYGGAHTETGKEHALLSALYLRLGDPYKSATHLEKAIEIEAHKHPDPDSLAEKLVQVAALYDTCGDRSAEGLKVASEAVRCCGNRPDLAETAKQAQAWTTHFQQKLAK